MTRLPWFPAFALALSPAVFWSAECWGQVNPQSPATRVTPQAQLSLHTAAHQRKRAPAGHRAKRARSPWAAPLPSPGRRPGLGRIREWVVGIENLAGFDFVRSEPDPAHQQLSLLSLHVIGSADRNLLSFPGISLDYFLIEGLSLGLQVGYSQTFTLGGGESDGAVSLSKSKFGARVGYAWPFEAESLWIRGGAQAIQAINTDSQNGANSPSWLSLTVLNVDAGVAIHGGQPLAFLITPQFHYVVAHSGPATTTTSPPLLGVGLMSSILLLL